MSLEELPRGGREYNAPMVSICGGEPLIHPQIEALVKGILEQKRIVYVCTNAMFMRKKMREWLTEELRNAETGNREPQRTQENLQMLVSDLVSAKECESVRNPKAEGTSRRSDQAGGCIGMCISTAWSGRTI